MRPTRTASTLAILLVTSGALTACGNDDQGDLTAFCSLVTDRSQITDTFSGLDPDNVDAALETFRSARETQARLRDLAPGAARADIDTVLSFVDDVIAGLEQADPESSEPPAVYTDLKPRFDEVEAASQRLNRYVDSNC